jgi:outer membrane protein W
MKNAISVLLLCLGAATLAAQETLSFGPVVGANFSRLSDIGGGVDVEFKPGIVAGGQLIYSNVNNWGVGGAVLYSREGVKTNNRDVETKTNITYIRVPLKFHYFFRDNEDNFRPKIFAGPSFGILLDADSKTGDVETDLGDTFNTFDLGLTAGAGLNARIAEGTWFNLDIGYTYGFLDVAENADGSNRGITATAGVLFGF